MRGLATLVALLVIVGGLAWLKHDFDETKRLRSEVAEGFLLAEPVQQAVASFYRIHRDYPATNRQAGLAEPTALSGDSVRSVAIDHGVVTVTYGEHADPRIAGHHLAFAPRAVAQTLAWTCLPAAGTDVDPLDLPISCRNPSR